MSYYQSQSTRCRDAYPPVSTRCFPICVRSKHGLYLQNTKESNATLVLNLRITMLRSNAMCSASSQYNSTSPTAFQKVTQEA